MGKSKKTPEAERYIRQALEQFTPHHVVSDAIIARYKVHRDTAMAWIYQCYAEIHEDEKPLKMFRKVRNRKAMEKLAFHCIRMAETSDSPQWATVAIRALDHLAKLDGLYEPDKVEVTETRRRPEDMTPLERKNAIEALLEKRREAGLDELVSN